MGAGPGLLPSRQTPNRLPPCFVVFEAWGNTGTDGTDGAFPSVQAIRRAFACRVRTSDTQRMDAGLFGNFPVPKSSSGKFGASSPLWNSSDFALRPVRTQDW